MKKLLLGIGVFGLALGAGIVGISYASEIPMAKEVFIQDEVSPNEGGKHNLLEDVLEGLVEEEALSEEQADTILNTMAATKLEMKAEREELKNLIKEMLEDGEITVVELDSVATIDQEKIDRFKDHFSEELEDGVISEEEFKDNIKSLADAKKVKPSDISACVLERDRHSEIIESLREIGSKVILIPDGDVAGVMMTSQEEIDVDIYFGTGGAPEGVLAAAALQCIGGQMQTRLVIRNDDEKKRAEKAGIKDLEKKYYIDDLASGDIIFVATGVTEGTMVKGVKKYSNSFLTHSIVLRSDFNTTQFIQTYHPQSI